jgi:hypothetical protein
MEEVLRLQEFFIEGGNPEESHVLLHITEPSAQGEEVKGYFFALCKVERGTPDYIELLEKAIEGSEKKYYQGGDEPPELALEKALDLMNKQTTQLLRPYLSLHMAIGVVVQNSIIFSFYGKPHINLYYKSREAGYKIMDLVKENTPAEPTKPSTQTIFSQIIQGKITSGDYILVASPGSTSTIPAEQLKQLITTRTPKESTVLIERSLRSVPSDQSFGGLVMHLAPPLPQPIAPVKSRPLARGSQQSLQHFFSTEQKTNETLTSSFSQHLGNKLQSRFSKLQTSGRDSRFSQQERKGSEEENNYIPPRSRDRYRKESRGVAVAGSLGRALLIAATYSGQVLIKLVSWIGDILITIIHTIGNLGVVIVNYHNRRNVILDSWARTWRGYKEHFFQLPILTKIMFLLALVLIGIFIGSIFHIRQTHLIAEENRVYEEKVQTIKTALTNAESALVYNNTATAIQQLNDVSTTLSNLPCTSAERNATCKTLQTSLNDLRGRSRKLITIDPTLLTTFNANDSAAPGLLKLGTQLLVFSANTSSIFSYNLLTKEAKYLSTTSTGYTTGAVPKENDYALLTDTNQNFIELNPHDSSFKAISISFPTSAANRQISSLVIYNRRLYSLDSMSGQLYRHDVIRSGFGLGHEWVKNNLNDTQGGVDVTVDGDIFIINPDGKITKLTNGVKQDFSIQGLDPALTNASKIWTYTDLTYIYILDSSQKRLIIADKTGKLIRQITSPLFEKPSDMVIEEQNKVAYFVDGEKLYKIDLPN